MKKITFRSPLMALLAFVTVIGMSGLVYAHWFGEGAGIGGDVQTSGLGAMWLDGWTNDDGINNGEGEGGGPGDVFDAWGSESSRDPSADGRYDKDVGRCTAEVWDDGGWLGVQLQNVYPSYHCTFSGLLGGYDDNIPAMTKGFVAYADEFLRGWVDEFDEWAHYPVCWEESLEIWYAETHPDFDGDCEGTPTFFNGADFEVFPVYFDVELDGTTIVVSADGEPVLTIWGDHICGEQVDPAWWWEFSGFENTATFSASVHVEQGAEQYSGYGFAIHPLLTNWNEYEPDMCEVLLLPTRPDGF